MHQLFSALDMAYHRVNPGLSTLLPALLRYDKRQIWPQLWHPDFTDSKVIRQTFQNSHPETMGVVSDIIRWAQHGQIDIGSEQHANYTPHFHSIHVPVIAAWGERDILAPPKCGDIFMRTISSHTKQRLVLHNARHIDIVAGQPAQPIIEAIVHLYRRNSSEF